MALLSPVVAAVGTLAVGLVVFPLLGRSPLVAFHAFFVTPLSTLNGVAELWLKAAPLMTIATGLAIGFRANVWNVGAEGQLVSGRSRAARWPSVRRAARRGGGSS